jgi:hypothetical protein
VPNAKRSHFPPEYQPTIEYVREHRGIIDVLTCCQSPLIQLIAPELGVNRHANGTSHFPNIFIIDIRDSRSPSSSVLSPSCRNGGSKGFLLIVDQFCITLNRPPSSRDAGNTSSSDRSNSYVPPHEPEQPVEQQYDQFDNVHNGQRFLRASNSA